MKFSDFTGEVQHRVDVGEQGRAVRVTRAVLTTLGERVQADEAKDLASPLPMEIDRFLLEADSGQRFGYAEFVERVADRANADESDAAFMAQSVVTLLWELEPEGEFEDIRDGLPAEFDDLFEFVGQKEAAPWA